jgi:hypothetical protein
MLREPSSTSSFKKACKPAVFQLTIFSLVRHFQQKVLNSDIVVNFHPQVVQLTKFDYRLSNRLETDLQKLRCRINYHALQFTDPILKMGEMLIQRMRAKSGRFIALHLR